MNNLPNISEAEWEIMKIIWKKDEITANEIIEEVGKGVHWKSSTVKTLINRLLNKNVIAFNKLGKEYVYYAIVSEEDCIIAESESFLQRVFNGSINSMVLNFVKSKKLTEEDIDELKNILNKHRK